MYCMIAENGWVGNPARPNWRRPTYLFGGFVQKLGGTVPKVMQTFQSEEVTNTCPC